MSDIFQEGDKLQNSDVLDAMSLNISQTKYFYSHLISTAIELGVDVSEIPVLYNAYNEYADLLDKYEDSFRDFTYAVGPMDKELHNDNIIKGLLLTPPAIIGATLTLPRAINYAFFKANHLRKLHSNLRFVLQKVMGNHYPDYEIVKKPKVK